MNTSSDLPEHSLTHSAHESFDADSLFDVFNRFTFAHNQSPDSAGNEIPAHGALETEWPAVDDEASRPEAERVEASLGEELATYIRPYAWTGGRTKSKYQLELETLVSTSDLCRTANLERLEHYSIADLCQQPRSVAEVGAFLSVPLGVTKVLLGDMADLGLIVVHHTVRETGGSSHLMLMERVLSGLRRL